VIENVKEEIARVAMKPIINRLSRQAYDQVVECFCLPTCGHTPGQLCIVARETQRRLIAVLFQEYSRLN